jgi:hypothetical protein
MLDLHILLQPPDLLIHVINVIDLTNQVVVVSRLSIQRLAKNQSMELQLETWERGKIMKPIVRERWLLKEVKLIDCLRKQKRLFICPGTK